MLFEAFRLVFNTRVTVKMDHDLRSIFASGRCKRRWELRIHAAYHALGPREMQ